MHTEGDAGNHGALLRIHVEGGHELAESLA
jgi:hypothetical protein